MKTIKSLLPDLSKLVTHDYKLIKTEETESIISSLLSKGEVSDTPSFIHVSGIPGAGKSTYIETRLSHETSVVVQLDAIMTKLRDYQTAVDKDGPAEAFKAFEMTARVIGFELLSRAIDAKKNIIFEYSLNAVHLPLYSGLRNLGYLVRLVFVTTSVGTAMSRVSEREKKVGRHTPKTFIEERDKLAQALLPLFEKEALGAVLIFPNP